MIDDLSVLMDVRDSFNAATRATVTLSDVEKWLFLEEDHSIWEAQIEDALHSDA